MRMRASWIVLALLAGAGCGFQSEAAPGGGDDGATPPGGDDDGQPPGGGSQATPSCAFATQLSTCPASFGAELDLQGTLTYDTDAGAFTDGNGKPVAIAFDHTVMDTHSDKVDVIYASSVVLASGTMLHAKGSFGLAILASGAITLDTGAMIDVSAGGAGQRTTCSLGPGKGDNENLGGGGGGGGGFGGDGGTGGHGNKDHGVFGGSESNGGAGGAAVGIPQGPRGGCPGADGGAGSNGGGKGGLGGGGLYLAAGDQIMLATGAALDAGGGGGGAGTQTGGNDGDAGGGGGGTGGVIWLEAPHVHADPSAAIVANGGSGGQGSGGGHAGNPGIAGTLTVMAAAGGANAPSSSGAAGGDGGSQSQPDGATATDYQDGGGGGGGGSVGYIHVTSADASLGVVSPNLSK
jgi:hypothetical protein